MKKLLKEWVVQFDGNRYPAYVPGDVTMDLTRAGLIPDLQYADNCVTNQWVHETCFPYETVFDLEDEYLEKRCLKLCFQGIDTFSDIYFNGELLGSTNNMFLPYEYDVKSIAKKTGNRLVVVLKPIVDELKKVGKADYIAAFMAERLLIRKAQCHFGWDWAPNYPGYGIWQNVTVSATDECIEYVRVMPSISGDVTFIAEVNYTVREGHEKSRIFAEMDSLRVSVSADGGKTFCAAAEVEIKGFQNILNLKVDSPKLWFPNGYGEQNLYQYKAELLRQGVAVDTVAGRFAFREVQVLQKPFGADSVGFQVTINGLPIFCQGSNWVPADIMTGCITEDRYEKLIRFAKEGNFNMLRVWGGGIYEKDWFYDFCDEYGIMVWHDFMFACGDVPDEHDWFNRTVVEEAVYQVKRLNAHPCVVAWNGGNEIKSAFRYSPNHLGEFLTDYILSGICAKFTDVPFFSCCPWSLTDFGNDQTSGECHKSGAFESLEIGDAAQFRKHIVPNKPFTTECCMIGSCRVKSLKKFLPPDKLWPMNDLWETHLVFNPYNDKLPKSFAKQELMLVEQIFGGADGLTDFVKKSMTVHSEVLLAEIEFARSEKKTCGGIMNWMYNDIWATATWSVVDYYLERKPVYYAMKRGFEPVRAFVYLRDGNWFVCVDNNTAEALTGSLCFGQKQLDGEVLWKRSETVTVGGFSNAAMKIAQKMQQGDCYTFAYFKDAKSVAFLNGFQNLNFETDIAVHVGEAVKAGGEYRTPVEIAANRFARTVFIDAEDANGSLSYSDNYFDLEKGDSKTVFLTGANPVEPKSITVKTFADEWND